MALSFAAMAAEWILLVAGVKFHEMIVGAASIIASAAFLYAVTRTQTLQLEIRWREVLACRYIPGYVVRDTLQIVLALYKDLFLHKPAGSLYKVCPFKADAQTPLQLTRQVLVTAYTSATPNSIVIGIDSEQNRMLFHQIVPDGVSKMAASLGATP